MEENERKKEPVARVRMRKTSMSEEVGPVGWRRASAGPELLKNRTHRQCRALKGWIRLFEARYLRSHQQHFPLTTAIPSPSTSRVLENYPTNWRNVEPTMKLQLAARSRDSRAVWRVERSPNFEARIEKRAEKWIKWIYRREECSGSVLRVEYEGFAHIERDPIEKVRIIPSTRDFVVCLRCQRKWEIMKFFKFMKIYLLKHSTGTGNLTSNELKVSFNRNSLTTSTWKPRFSRFVMRTKNPKSSNVPICNLVFISLSLLPFTRVSFYRIVVLEKWKVERTFLQAVQCSTWFSSPFR